MNQTEFINLVEPGAVRGWTDKKILPSVSIAQAILESGWGRYAPGNNLFGIKANGWNGQTQLLSTHEYIGGKYVAVKATFRAYASWADSIADHAAFLSVNKRYANLIGCTDYKRVCQMLQADGYATSPTYAQSLIALIEQYKLYQYDNVAAQNSTAPAVKYYVVVKGDTLSGIAAKYGTTYPKIAAANGIKPPYIIYVGDRLKIA